MKPWFRDFVLLVVPAIIALAMVGTSVYLMVWTDKEIPAFLVNSMTTILGYYFGIGVNSNLSNGKVE